MICEKCWADAHLRSTVGGDQITHYLALLDERKDKPCRMQTQKSPGTTGKPQSKPRLDCSQGVMIWGL